MTHSPVRSQRRSRAPSAAGLWGRGDDRAELFVRELTVVV